MGMNSVSSVPCRIVAKTSVKTVFGPELGQLQATNWGIVVVLHFFWQIERR